MSRAKLLMPVSARLFAGGGFEATSMRDIAGPRPACWRASMYYHFPSKNDLIAAVYEAGVAEISALRSTRRWRQARYAVAAAGGRLRGAPANRLLAGLRPTPPS